MKGAAVPMVELPADDPDPWRALARALDHAIGETSSLQTGLIVRVEYHAKRAECERWMTDHIRNVYYLAGLVERELEQISGTVARKRGRYVTAREYLSHGPLDDSELDAIEDDDERYNVTRYFEEMAKDD